MRSQVGISHVSDNYPIGAKQNVFKDDSALHAHGDFHGGWSNFMYDAMSKLSTLDFGEFFNLKPHTTEFPLYFLTATFDKQQILKAKGTCENQFDNKKANNLFAARRNILQCCKRKMKVVSQKDNKNKLITLRSIVFQLY